MTETNHSYSVSGEIFLILFLGWIFWIWLCPTPTLEEIGLSQKQELCTASTFVCELWYGNYIPEVQTFLATCLEATADWLPENELIESFFNKLYFLGCIATGRLVQVLFCVLLALPVPYIALKLGALKVQIDRLGFNGELPSVMRRKWSIFRLIVIGTIAICLVPLTISMVVLLTLVGVQLLCLGWIWAVTWRTNQP